MTNEPVQLVVHDIDHAVHTLRWELRSLQDRSRAALGDRGRQSLEQIGEGMMILDELIAALPGGGGEADPVRPVTLSAILDQVYTALRGQFEARGIRFRRGPLPNVQGRERSLRRVFLNLLGNTILHMGNAPEREVEVTAREEGAEAVICVRDTGPGFSPETAEDVLRRIRSDGSDDTAAGAGLGLLIVRRLIRAHGGRVWIESARGDGTTIYLTLPRVVA